MKPAPAKIFKLSPIAEEATTIGSKLEFCKAEGCGNFAISSDPKEANTLNYYCEGCKKKAIERGESGKRLNYRADSPYQHANEGQRQRRIDAIFGKVR